MSSLCRDSLVELLKSWFAKSIFHVEEYDFLDQTFYAELEGVFQADYNRYFQSQKILVDELMTRVELVGILLYRIARQIYLTTKDEVLAGKFSNLGRTLSGFEIYFTAEIKSGLKINHGIGTVIGARVRIGKDCLIHQGVTFGDKDGRRPVLLDRVTVYAGAKIIGDIIVGNDAIIGANCVCMSSVPDGQIMAGVPGKILRNKYE